MYHWEFKRFQAVFQKPSQFGRQFQWINSNHIACQSKEKRRTRDSAILEYLSILHRSLQMFKVHVDELVYLVLTVEKKNSLN